MLFIQHSQVWWEHRKGIEQKYIHDIKYINEHAHGISPPHTHTHKHKHNTHITRQSEMANTSPRHMPVLGNVHPIKIENFDIFS